MKVRSRRAVAGCPRRIDAALSSSPTLRGAISCPRRAWGRSRRPRAAPRAPGRSARRAEQHLLEVLTDQRESDMAGHRSYGRKPWCVTRRGSGARCWRGIGGTAAGCHARHRDPYRVWVSEVMLQQTQVATATPYYERFVARSQRCARSRGRAPTACWRVAGLGYYRRARQLHAARHRGREHAGRVPSDPRAFGALPGVGRYTLGAVRYWFGTPLPVLMATSPGCWRALRATAFAQARGRRASAVGHGRDAAAGGRGGRHAQGRRGQAGDAPGAARRVRARAGPPIRRLEPGAHGTRRHRVHTARPPLRRVPRTASLPGVRARPAESFPPAASGARPSPLRRAIVVLERRGRTLVVRRRERCSTPVGAAGTGARPRTSGARALAPLRRTLARLGFRARITDTGGRLTHVITTLDHRRGLACGAHREPPRRVLTHAGPSRAAVRSRSRRWRGASSTAARGHRERLRPGAAGPPATAARPNGLTRCGFALDWSCIHFAQPY